MYFSVQEYLSKILRSILLLAIDENRELVQANNTLNEVLSSPEET